MGGCLARTAKPRPGFRMRQACSECVRQSAPQVGGRVASGEQLPPLEHARRSPPHCSSEWTVRAHTRPPICRNKEAGSPTDNLRLALFGPLRQSPSLSVVPRALARLIGATQAPTRGVHAGAHARGARYRAASGRRSRQRRNSRSSRGAASVQASCGCRSALRQAAPQRSQRGFIGATPRRRSGLRRLGDCVQPARIRPGQDPPPAWHPPPAWRRPLQR